MLLFSSSEILKALNESKKDNSILNFFSSDSRSLLSYPSNKWEIRNNKIIVNYELEHFECIAKNISGSVKILFNIQDKSIFFKSKLICLEKKSRTIVYGLPEMGMFFERRNHQRKKSVEKIEMHLKINQMFFNIPCVEINMHGGSMLVNKNFSDKISKGDILKNVLIKNGKTNESINIEIVSSKEYGGNIRISFKIISFSSKFEQFISIMHAQIFA